MSFIAAVQNGHNSICRWIQKSHDSHFRDCTALRVAAEQGKWAAAKALCSLQADLIRDGHKFPRLPTLAVVQGNLDFIQWCKSRRLSCLIPESAVSRLAAEGRFDIVHGLLARKIQLPRLREAIFSAAIAHHKPQTLRLMASLGVRIRWPQQHASWRSGEAVAIPADASLRELAVALTPVQAGDPLWNFVLREAILAAPTSRSPGDVAWDRYVDLMRWLGIQADAKVAIPYDRHLDFGPPWDRWQNCREAVVLVEMAAQGLQPHIPWGPRTHGIAAAQLDTAAFQRPSGLYSRQQETSTSTCTTAALHDAWWSLLSTTAGLCPGLWSQPLPKL